MAGSVSTTGGDRGFAAAFRALHADGRTQFDLTPPPPPVKLPSWIEALGRWLRVALRPLRRAVGWLADHVPEAPYARVLLWSVLAVAAAGLAWLLVDRIRRWRRGDAIEAAAEPDWLPDVGTARALLAEAEALAARGAFDEAVRRLLHRSVEDIAHRRPRVIVPSLTSRDIAASPALPAAARTTFGAIAALVERSLFAGHAVGAADWARARAAYADLMLRRTWAA